MQKSNDRIHDLGYDFRIRSRQHGGAEHLQCVLELAFPRISAAFQTSRGPAGRKGDKGKVNSDVLEQAKLQALRAEIDDMHRQDRNRRLRDGLRHRQRHHARHRAGEAAGAVGCARQGNDSRRSAELAAQLRPRRGLDLHRGGLGAEDPASKTCYLYHEYCRSQAEPIVHAAAIKAVGEWVPA